MRFITVIRRWLPFVMRSLALCIRRTPWKTGRCYGGYFRHILRHERKGKTSRQYGRASLGKDAINTLTFYPRGLRSRWMHRACPRGASRPLCNSWGPSIDCPTIVANIPALRDALRRPCRCLAGWCSDLDDNRVTRRFRELVINGCLACAVVDGEDGSVPFWPRRANATENCGPQKAHHAPACVGLQAHELNVEETRRGMRWQTIFWWAWR